MAGFLKKAEKYACFGSRMRLSGNSRGRRLFFPPRSFGKGLGECRGIFRAPHSFAKSSVLGFARIVQKKLRRGIFLLLSPG